MGKATDTFRKLPWCHNCAQAVANNWRQLYDNPDTILDEYYTHNTYVGHHNKCPCLPRIIVFWLFAAQKALPQFEKEITDKFCEIAGDTTCMAIKQKAKTSCPVCVETADILIEEFSSK